MSNRVDADVDGLRNLRRDIERAQASIDAAMKQLRASLARTQWRDSARQAFETQLNETMGSLRQFNINADALKPILSKKIASLEAYLRG